MKNQFKKLIEWSLQTHREIPWRKDRSLYRTLVSEIMLQQTTVATVRNKFDDFFQTFPSLKSLSEATEEKLRVVWKGLGYYRRCKNLKAAADVLVRQYKGKFPENQKQLLEIPGIGNYTANALLAIGMDKPALALDANLERVLSRYCGIHDVPKGPKLQRVLEDKFTQGQLKFLRQFSARQLNEALMDLGREVCTAREARCLICPLVSTCQAYSMGNQLQIPLQDKSKKAVKVDLVLARVLIKKKDKVFLVQRKAGTWLEGQWELPSFVMSCNQEKEFKQYQEAPKKLQKLFSTNPVRQFKTTITNYKITNKIFETNDHKLIESGQGKWFLINKTSDISQATKKSL